MGSSFSTMKLVGGLTAIAALARTALSADNNNVCQPPTDHSIRDWTQCSDTNINGVSYQRWVGYGIFQTRIFDAYAYCKRLETYYGAIGTMNLVSAYDNDMNTCVDGLLKNVSTTVGDSYPAVASIGTFYNNNTGIWGWSDGHQMSTGSDYNNCTHVDDNGLCAPQNGQNCLVADATGDRPGWESYPCLDAHVNFICEYTCNPNGGNPDVNPDDWPPQPPHPPCWWCDDNRPGMMQQMVGFIGNTSSDPTIYVQEQDMTVNQLTLPPTAAGSNPQFPYIAYNPLYGAFEVVGSFNQEKESTPNGNGNGSYHYTVDFINTQTKIQNSNYDSRSYSSLVYVEDVNNTIFVGGYPPNVDSPNYSRVVSRPLIYSTENQKTSQFTLPTSWPSSYYCNNVKCQILSFPQTQYHNSRLFVVGGSSYAYCPSPNAFGANGNIWSLTFDPSLANTDTELKWQVYTNLQTAYGTCRGVMSFDQGALNNLLTTTLNYVDSQVSYTGFEAIEYVNNKTYPTTSGSAFARGNDMPVQFATLATASSNVKSWNVMGGAMRDQSLNLETIYNGEGKEGFKSSTTPNFPNSLYGKQLLGTTLSNQYAAPLYYN